MKQFKSSEVIDNGSFHPSMYSFSQKITNRKPKFHLNLDGEVRLPHISNDIIKKNPRKWSFIRKKNPFIKSNYLINSLLKSISVQPSNYYDIFENGLKFKNCTTLYIFLGNYNTKDCLTVACKNILLHLKQFPVLKELSIIYRAGLSFQNIHLEILTKCLQYCSSLIKFRLAIENNFSLTDYGIQVLSRRIRKAHCIKNLKIEFPSWGGISEKGIALISQSIPFNAEESCITIKNYSSTLKFKESFNQIQTFAKYKKINLGYYWQGPIGDMDLIDLENILHSLKIFSSLVMKIKDYDTLTVNATFSPNNKSFSPKNFALDVSNTEANSNLYDSILNTLSGFTSIEEISFTFLNSSKFYDKNIILVANTLKSLTQLKKLKFLCNSNLRITSKSLESLSSSLTKLKNLNHLDINFSRTAVTKEGVALIVQALKPLAELRNLNLEFAYYQKSNSKSFKGFSDSLLHLHNLETLNINLDFLIQKTLFNINVKVNNEIATTEHELLLIAHALQSTWSIREITVDLFNCARITETVLNFFVKRLTQFQILNKLNIKLPDCAFCNDKNLQSVANWLQNLSFLTFLELSFPYSPHITDKGIVEFSKAIIETGNLESCNLDFSFCDSITELAAKKLLESLIQKVDNFELKIFFSTLSFNKNSLTCNSIGVETGTDKDLNLLLYALQKINRIEHLQISNDNYKIYTQDGCIALANELKKVNSFRIKVNHFFNIELKQSKMELFSAKSRDITVDIRFLFPFISTRPEISFLSIIFFEYPVIADEIVEELIQSMRFIENLTSFSILCKSQMSDYSATKIVDFAKSLKNLQNFDVQNLIGKFTFSKNRLELAGITRLYDYVTNANKDITEVIPFLNFNKSFTTFSLTCSNMSDIDERGMLIIYGYLENQTQLQSIEINLESIILQKQEIFSIIPNLLRKESNLNLIKIKTFNCIYELNRSEALITPVQQFFSNNRTRVVPMTIAGILNTSKFIRGLTELKKFSFIGEFGSEVSANGFQEFVSEIQILTSLTEINLKFNICDKLTEKDFVFLSEILAMCKNLEKISISFPERLMNQASMKSFAKLFSNLPNLQIFELPNINLKVENHTLSSITLNQHYWFCQEYIKHSTNLVELIICPPASLQICDKKLFLIADILENGRNLQVLDLNLLTEKITENGLNSLVESFGKLISIRKFTFNLNNTFPNFKVISDLYIARVFENIKNHKHLEEINFDFHQSKALKDSATILSISEIVKSMNQLKKISLEIQDYENIPSEDIENLCHAIFSLPLLERIVINLNEFRFSLNENFVSLGIEHTNHITKVVSDSLYQCLKKCSTVLTNFTLIVRDYDKSFSDSELEFLNNIIKTLSNLEFVKFDFHRAEKINKEQLMKFISLFDSSKSLKKISIKISSCPEITSNCLQQFDKPFKSIPIDYTLSLEEKN